MSDVLELKLFWLKFDLPQYSKSSSVPTGLIRICIVWICIELREFFSSSLFLLVLSTAHPPGHHDGKKQVRRRSTRDRDRSLSRDGNELPSL
jgi:hypothetical protein